MTEYRVFTADGVLWGRFKSEFEAATHARSSAKRYPDRAPFTVQLLHFHHEWIDVPEEVTE